MFSRQTFESPWPAETPLPAASSSSSLSPSRRRRTVAERHAEPAAIAERATIANQSQIDQAKAECFDADFAIFSCWPTESASLFQNQGTQFVWNSRHPDFTQFNLVDIALKRADTGDIILQFLNQTNPSNRAGSLPVIANDTWWGASGADWPGTNVAFPLCFIIVPSGKGFDYIPPQSTFTAIQTTFANSVLASMSSSAAAASSSSVAASLSSLSSLSSATATTSSPTDSSIVTTINGVPTTLSSGHGGSGLQNGNNSSSPFPHWAIAVIVILGFFALAALIALLFLIFQRIRRRNDVSRRGSMGSQSPMMENVARNDSAYPTSPTVGAPPGSSGVGTGAGLGAGAALGGGSLFGGDGASTHSDAIISGADAAVMAEAFRKALRKPDFAGQPVEEGESPDAEGHHEVMSRELAEEGRDIRSVGSTRTPRVETMSDTGDTATARDSLV